MNIIFLKSDLAWNRFSNIDENSSDEEIINAIKEFYSHEWSEVEVTIENGNDAYFLFEKMGFDITRVLMNLDI